jgi:hypothetical protein
MTSLLRDSGSTTRDACGRRNQREDRPRLSSVETIRRLSQIRICTTMGGGAGKPAYGNWKPPAAVRPPQHGSRGRPPTPDPNEASRFANRSQPWPRRYAHRRISPFSSACLAASVALTGPTGLPSIPQAGQSLAGRRRTVLASPPAMTAAAAATVGAHAARESRV